MRRQTALLLALLGCAVFLMASDQGWVNQALMMYEITTPDTPPSGHQSLWMGTDGVYRAIDDAGGSLDRDHVGAFLAVEIQRDARVCRDIRRSGRPVKAVDQEFVVVDDEPHRRGLRLPVGSNGRQPHDQCIVKEG